MAAKKVGQLVVNVTGGTAQLIVDLEKAKSKVSDFGNHGNRVMDGFKTHTVSAMQASSASIRLLENPLGNNLRALERFSGMLPGVSRLFSAAFPIAGAVAAGNIVFELGGKFRKFYEDMKNAPQRLNVAFRELNTPVRGVNDELRVTADRLDMNIAKLEGRHQNGLKLSLDSAVVSANNLANALDQDLAKLNKLLDEKKIGFFGGLMGKTQTGAIRDEFGGGDLFGDGGYGKFREQQAQIEITGRDKMRAASVAGDSKASEAARKEMEAALIAGYAHLRDRANELRGNLDKAAKAPAPSGNGGALGSPLYNPGSAAFTVPPDSTEAKKQLSGIAEFMQENIDRIRLTSTVDADTAKQTKLETDKQNAKPGDLIEKRLKALRDQLGEVQAKFESVGKDDVFKAQMEGAAAALKELDKLNAELKEYGQHVNASTVAEVKSLSVKIKMGELDTAWASKVDATKNSIDERIKSQEMLTAAIGQGYEATKKASVETSVMAFMGKDYGKPARAADEAAIRGKYNNSYDADFKLQSDQAIQSLKDQTELERQLTAVRSQGLEIVRLTTLAFQVSQLRKAGKDGDADALIDQQKAARASLTAQTVADLNLEIEAAQKLAAAEMSGAEEARKQALENKYAAMAFHDTAKDVIDLERQKDELAHKSSVTAEALATSRAYQKNIEDLSAQLSVVKELERNMGATRDLEIDRQRIEKQLSEVLVQQALATGKLKDGLRAFFTEAKAQAEQPGKILYDSLNRAVDGFSSSLTKALTGQKGEWGKLLKDLGNQALESTIKSQLQRGIGAVGDKLGLTLSAPDGSVKRPFYVIPLTGAASVVPGLSKPGGLFGGGSQGNGIYSFQKSGGIFGGGLNTGQSADTAIWVRVAQSGQSGQKQQPAKPSFWGSFLGALIGGIAGGAAGGLGGGAGGGESVSSSIHFANGGDTPLNTPYWVGENGPELRVDRGPGTIIPNNRIGGAGDVHIHVDARGATDPALTVLRVRQGMQATHESAVKTAMLAIADRQGRVPR